MNLRYAILFVAISGAGCTTANSAELTVGAPAATVTAATSGSANVTVQMTAATLGEDCGGTGAPYTAPVPGPAPAAANAKRASGAGAASMQQPVCHQTAMQLSVVGGAMKEPAQIRVKKVEIFDSTGKSIGELTPRTPMSWSAKDSSYLAWDETVSANQKLSVSYSLNAPNWAPVGNRWGQTFVVKATVTVGGKDQTVQHDVRIEAPTHLPPGVVT